MINFFKFGKDYYGENMKKYYTRSDLAIESLAYATKDKDYKHHVEKENDITIETFEILTKSELYPHEIGQYVEMSFPDYQDISTLSFHFKKQLNQFIKALTQKLDPRILFVGLGNAQEELVRRERGRGAMFKRLNMMFSQNWETTPMPCI